MDLYKRGRYYWLKEQTIRLADGRRLPIPRQTTRQTDRSLAHDWARNYERTLLEGKQPRLWSGFVTEFLNSRPDRAPATMKQYTFVTGKFGQHLFRKGVATLAGITGETISSYIQARRLDLHPTRLTPVGPEGIKKDLRVLRCAFNYAVEKDYIARLPMKLKGLNTRAGKTLPFSDAEVAAMLRDFDPRGNPDLHAVLLTFLHTGFRNSDVCGLRRSDVDLSGAAPRIWKRTQKRKTDVWLPLPASLAASLTAHLARLSPRQRLSPFVFPTETGRQMSTTNLGARLGRLFRRCRIPNAHPHRFRDTFVVGMLRAGANTHDCARAIGASVQVVERHYAPFVLDLQERMREKVLSVSYAGAPA